MSIKRIALAGIIAVALTLTACSTGEPSETTTPTTTPTPTKTDAGQTIYEPPVDEAEAITAAEHSIDQLLLVQSEINAAGGVDASRYNDITMGKALDLYTRNATRIATGPLANEDGENIEGQSHSEGIIVFEQETAYGQELDGIANGLVLLPGCLDTSGYKITTADGKPAYRADINRTKVEFQVSYDAERKLWLVSNRIDFEGQTC